jgi:hypothetical protein
MLVPIYLGLCRAADLNRGHEAAGALINANLGMAVLVSVVHSVTMIAAGGFLAWLVYRYLGLTYTGRYTRKHMLTETSDSSTYAPCTCF